MRILRPSGAPVICVAYHPHGEELVAGDDDGTVHSWRLPGGEGYGTRKHQGAVEALAWSADALSLAGSLEGGKLWVMNREGEVKKPDGHGGGVRALCWRGPLLFAGGWDRNVSAWDMNTGRSTIVLTKLARPVTALCPIPDSNFLAVGTNGEGVIVVEQTKYQRYPLGGNQGIFGLAATRDGKILAGGDSTGTITLWDFASREDDKVPQLGTLQGHSWTVYGLGFTPDGGRLVSAAADGTLRVWDVAQRRELSALKHNSSALLTLAVAPDGMTAATGGQDGAVILWDLADT